MTKQERNRIIFFVAVLLVIALLFVTKLGQAQTKPKKFSHLDGYTQQNTHCVETVAGFYKGQPVWFVWQTTQCRPRAKFPQSGNRVIVPVEKLGNILDQGDLIVVYPR